MTTPTPSPRRFPFTATAVAALLLLVASTRAVADGAIQPTSAGDSWTQAVTDEGGKPLIHSLRAHALELANRARFGWRLGVTWRFRHVLDSGMPAREDRAPMMAIDDAIHDLCEHDDDNRIVYFTTGGGMREVVLYAASEPAARGCIDRVFKKFPDWFPGNRNKWSYVQKDADWAGYRAIAKIVAAAPPPPAR